MSIFISPKITKPSLAMFTGCWLHLLPFQGLVGKSITLSVAQFVKVWVAGKVDHRWWSAQEDQVVTRWREENLLNHLCVDEAWTVLPTLRGPVHGVPQLEPVWVLFLNIFQLLPEQNVIFRLVSKEKAKTSLVLWIPEDRPDQLQHGGDACPPCDHADLGHLYLLALPLLVLLYVKDSSTLVDQQPTRSPHINSVSNGQALQMLGHLPSLRKLGMSVCWVDLDHQVHVAEVLIRAGGCVRPHHQTATNTGRQVDMLPDGQT